MSLMGQLQTFDAPTVEVRFTPAGSTPCDRTSTARLGRSVSCQSTKSLRDSPLRG